MCLQVVGVWQAYPYRFALANRRSLMTGTGFAEGPFPVINLCVPPPYSPTGDVVDIYQREFLALRDRLHAAEQESLKRSKELNLVLEEIKRAVSERQALRDGEGNRTWGRLTGELPLGWDGWKSVELGAVFRPSKISPVPVSTTQRIRH